MPELSPPPPWRILRTDETNPQWVAEERLLRPLVSARRQFSRRAKEKIVPMPPHPVVPPGLTIRNLIPWSIRRPAQDGESKS